MSELIDRYHAVLSSIEDACRSCQRERESVCLLAVSKFHPVESILTLAAAGQTVFGENYVQEAQEKSGVLAAHGYDPRAMIHIIGHLQRRKVPLVVGNYALLHTLDSLSLALAVEKRAAAIGIVQNVLIEVNLACEEQKAGVSQDDLFRFADDVTAKCPHVNIMGLMCIPPASAAGESARSYFARLREVRDALESRVGRKLPELSMGMSEDYMWAIAEGSTIVRVGTAIFGERTDPRH